MPPKRAPANPMQVPELPADADRCRATKTNGKRCRAWAGNGGFCIYHSGPHQSGSRPARSVGDVPYGVYLMSEWWDRRRQRALRDAGYHCGCGKTNGLEVHHLSYEHLWHEPEEDLMVLCADCHESVHLAKLQCTDLTYWVYTHYVSRLFRWGKIFGGRIDRRQRTFPMVCTCGEN